MPCCVLLGAAPKTPRRLDTVLTLFGGFYQLSSRCCCTQLPELQALYAAFGHAFGTLEASCNLMKSCEQACAHPCGSKHLHAGRLINSPPVWLPAERALWPNCSIALLVTLQATDLKYDMKRPCRFCVSSRGWKPAMTART